MKLRTLVLCGDAWHPAADVQRGLSALADARFEFEFVPQDKKWSPSLLDDFPLAMIAKVNHLCASDQRPWLTAKTQSSFCDFVRRGGGLFLIHGGTCYKEFPEMRAIIGGAFLSHPEQCPVTIEPKLGHRLTTSINAFSEKDEHYMMAVDAADADVFLYSRSEHGEQPAGWIRTEGKGRVCALTPGHNPEMWLHPEYQKLLRNGLAWLAKLY